MNSDWFGERKSVSRYNRRIATRGIHFVVLALAAGCAHAPQESALTSLAARFEQWSGSSQRAPLVEVRAHDAVARLPQPTFPCFAGHESARTMFDVLPNATERDAATTLVNFQSAVGRHQEGGRVILDRSADRASLLFAQLWLDQLGDKLAAQMNAREEDRCWALAGFQIGMSSAIAIAAYRELVLHQPMQRGMFELTDEIRSRGIGFLSEEFVPANAAASIKRLITFQLADGIKFVGVLHERGGLALVQRAIEHPPATTSQLLHPEKYFAGELPAPVAFPTPPPSWTVTAKGQVGELGIQTMLASCSLQVVPGEGWRGDAYTIARTYGRIALLWTTTWETIADADRFAGQFRQWSNCWDAVANSRPFYLQRRDNHVIVTRGLKRNELDSIAESMFQSVGEPPKPVPPLP